MRSRRLAYVLLFVLALSLVGYGAWRGEARLVGLKGGNICLECIGLG